MEPVFLVTVAYHDGAEEKYPVVDYAAKGGVLSLVRPSLPVRYIPLVCLRWYDAAGLARAADDSASGIMLP